MVKSAQFTTTIANGIGLRFSRGSVENKMPEEPYYDVVITRKEEEHSLRMKKNSNGHWGIEDRSSLPLWVRDFEPEFIKAVRQNEA